MTEVYYCVKKDCSYLCDFKIVGKCSLNEESRLCLCPFCTPKELMLNDFKAKNE